ncbi:C-terminal domain of homeodomain 1-domain-containing protein [Phlebopus sp. FC_14]|nr:C-terminal domain of homeodomain 1-domain-containing protein [Phlebopus sp. FC_14]
MSIRDNPIVYIPPAHFSHGICVANLKLNLQRKQEEFKTELLDGVEQMLHGMAQLSLLPSLSSRRPSTPDESPSPHFIAPAYQWLLQNIHYPYPSTEVKTAFARTSNCSLGSVNAAYRALVKEDPERKLSGELIQAFVTMKVPAEGLYSSTFTKSTLAGDLDMVVKDMTEENKRLCEEMKRREAEEARVSKEREKDMRRLQQVSERRIRRKPATPECYPSPQRACTSSPLADLEESLTDENGEDARVAPPVAAGHKRWSLSMDEPARATSEGRPLKRLRSCVSEVWTSLPSPPSTTGSVVESSDDDVPTRDKVSPDVTQTISRKRRLSDAELSSVPKRPRGLNAGPRLYAVSDPLPKSAIASGLGVDDWFNSNIDSLFSLPSPVDSGEPDYSIPLEVELFSNYCLPQDLQKDSFRFPKLDSANNADHTTTDVADLAEFDNLLQTIAGSGLEIPGPLATTCILPPYTHAMPSHKITSPSTFARSIDWTSLLHSPDNFSAVDTVLPPPYDTSSINLHFLPAIELSMLQLPQVRPPDNLRPAAAQDPSPKEAKLKQLQAMQEAVRQMEREILQSEGLVS